LLGPSFGVNPNNITGLGNVIFYFGSWIKSYRSKGLTQHGLTLSGDDFEVQADQIGGKNHEIVFGCHAIHI